MTPLLSALVLVVLCGGGAALLAPWLLRRASEPELEAGEVKTPYGSLATWRTAGAAGAWAAALALVSVMSVEPARLGPWLVVAVVGALASVVDVATTWIPRRWLHVAWLVTALSIAGTAWSLGDWTGIGRSALGVAIIGGAYGLVYLVSVLLDRGFFGFADVRLGVLTGMLAGWRSVPTATSALVLGSVIGALWGLANLRRRRDEPYPYGPGIVLGPYAVLLIALVTHQ
ncbi:MAG: prepilin peptidase [Actinobacteria bacterium]|nr:prepilin peptidase [Actinomycetota bacterium]